MAKNRLWTARCFKYFKELYNESTMTKKRLIAFFALLAVFALVVLGNLFFVSDNGSAEPRGATSLVGGGEGGGSAVLSQIEQQKGLVFAGDGGKSMPKATARIQGETAPEPIYETPKIADIAPIGFRIVDRQKGSLFMEYFATKPGTRLSEAEVFDRLWPPAYREGLKKVENLMVSEGYVADSERSPLNTDAEVYKTLNRIFGFARSRGAVDENDVASLERGLNELLPEIVKRERAALEGGAVGVSDIVLPGAQRLIYKKESGSLIADILDGLKYVLAVPEVAMASNDWTPSWNTKPDCYKDLNPMYPVYGFNGWVYCCNCGWKYVGVSVVFVEDCGPFSAACDIPDGCLNLICAAYPNAVWDQFTNPLGTGICGCG